MKVCISVDGRFHALHLAQQLQRFNCLHKLITTYPNFYIQRYDINKKYIHSLFANELLKRGWQKAPKQIRQLFNFDEAFSKLFMTRSKKALPKNYDLFVGWSGNSLSNITSAKKNGIKTVLERGSTHILHQQELLQEEYRQLNIPMKQITHPNNLARELAEYEACDYISIPTSVVYDSFVERGINPNKLLVTPYGVDCDLFKPAEKKDDVFRIIFCGHCCVRKGAQYLIQAFHELKLPNAELWFIGSVEPQLMPLINQYKSEKIIFLGSQPEHELPQFYQQGSIFCLPSIEEGQGLVINQAMACGLPIICTENTGGKDLLKTGNEGFVIPIRDVSALKDRIMTLYKDTQLSLSMGASARSTIETHFKWNHYGERVHAHYQTILNSDKLA